MTNTLRERLKSIQAKASPWATYPFLPREARALIAETVLLLTDLVHRLEQLEKETRK